MQVARLQPLAVFITFHTYGTWLPGDVRGSVTRGRNGYDEPFRAPCEALERRSRALMRHPPVQLDPTERASC